MTHLDVPDIFVKAGIHSRRLQDAMFMQSIVCMCIITVLLGNETCRNSREFPSLPPGLADQSMFVV